MAHQLMAVAVAAHQTRGRDGGPSPCNGRGAGVRVELEKLVSRAEQKARRELV